jgi:hypothetical protein
MQRWDNDPSGPTTAFPERDTRYLIAARHDRGIRSEKEYFGREMPRQRNFDFGRCGHTTTVASLLLPSSFCAKIKEMKDIFAVGEEEKESE